jgi:hypothetical protein
MSRFFELMDDRSSCPRWHLGTPLDEQGQELNPWQFGKGKRLELGCVPLFPLDVPGPPLDFCWAAFAILVVNARFVRLFERLGIPDVQFLPARVEGHPEPHFILNVLRVIRCIDDARCDEVQYWKPEDNRPEKLGEYRAVYGLKVDAAKIGGAPIFRPWGWRVALLVSQELKEAMEREGLTGPRFVPA